MSEKDFGESRELKPLRKQFVGFAGECLDRWRELIGQRITTRRYGEGTVIDVAMDEKRGEHFLKIEFGAIRSGLWISTFGINRSILSFTLREDTKRRMQACERAAEIRQWCADRGITSLMHFTKVENLRSILELGLLPRSLLEARGFAPSTYTDDRRSDGYPDAVCLSVSFPNFQMFFRKRCEARLQEWVVIELDAAVLWERDCAFYPDNAASADMGTLPARGRTSLRYIQAMFAEHHRGRSRSELSIPDSYPTNPQAEVLVFNTISPSYIRRVYFNSLRGHASFLRGAPKDTHVTFVMDGRYFERRRDWRHWQEKRSVAEPGGWDARFVDGVDYEDAHFWPEQEPPRVSDALARYEVGPDDGSLYFQPSLEDYWRADYDPNPPRAIAPSQDDDDVPF